MKVGEIMTTDLVTVSPATDITEAARLMRDADIGDVLVVDQGRLVGILTDRDITVRVIAQGIDPKQAQVGDYMTRDLFTGMPDWDVEDAADLLGEEQIRRLPIVESGRLVGIVSLGDIAVQFTQEEAACQALEEISEPAMPRIGAVRQ
ncbi:MAG: CBS domain-containing protein [Anaerolineae bacterium]|nr:CBS domain-containing protein [Anaerolineae bacterium]